MPIKVSRVSENCLIVYFGEKIDLKLIGKIARFTHTLEQHYGALLYEVIPSYTTVLVEYHPLKIEINQFINWCHRQAERVMQEQIDTQGKVVTLPVYYHTEVAPDLESLARDKNLTVQQVIDIHSQTDYTVCAIGFAPGFAFLGSVDAKIATPRHAEPRLKVAKGSVGIADQQTAVYPQQTPGGWQIIGNCPLDLFNIQHDPMMPFEVGDTVRFSPISRKQFIEMGGML